MTTLADIQGQLKAPKDQVNSFGKYKYRTAEGIIHAFKSLNSGASLKLSDDITMVGDFLFLKATATLTIGDEKHHTEAWAMHPAEKKGMDPAQITGMASSYARKYALNGLFAIDDSSEDPDAKDNEADKGHVKKLSWVETVVQDLPSNATPEDKARAIRDAIIAQWKSMKGQQQLMNEWDRREKVIFRMADTFPEFHSAIVDGYENRMIEITEDAA